MSAIPTLTYKLMWIEAMLHTHAELTTDQIKQQWGCSTQSARSTANSYAKLNNSCTLQGSSLKVVGDFTNKLNAELNASDVLDFIAVASDSAGVSRLVS